MPNATTQIEQRLYFQGWGKLEWWKHLGKGNIVLINHQTAWIA